MSDNLAIVIIVGMVLLAWVLVRIFGRNDEE